VPDRLERRHVILRPDLVVEPEDPDHHRRHHEHEIWPVLIDRAQRRLGVEAGQQHDVVAVEQPERGRGERRVVVQRTRDQHAAVAEHVQSRLGRDHRRVTGENQLRAPG